MENQSGYNAWLKAAESQILSAHIHDATRMLGTFSRNPMTPLINSGVYQRYSRLIARRKRIIQLWHLLVVIVLVLLPFAIAFAIRFIWPAAIIGSDVEPYMFIWAGMISFVIGYAMPAFLPVAMRDIDLGRKDYESKFFGK